jgi:hypothetical protein
MHSFTLARLGIRGLLRPRLGPLVFSATFTVAAFSHAQDQNQKQDTQRDATSALGLDPTSPQVGALPGGMTPAYGQKSTSDQDWRFDFHGFLTAPLNAGINSRHAAAPGQPDVRPGQSSTVLHSPPVVPDDFETFSHTGVVPTTYAQLNFSDGNKFVTANVSILARQANASESFVEPASQAGIQDVFLSFVPDVGSVVRLNALVGAFTSRYGATGEYDEGRYGTPLIARISGVGERVTARSTFGNMSLLLEQGIQGQSNKAGSSIAPDVWNGDANPLEGTTFVNHLHAGLAYQSLATLGGHFISAWSQDDRASSLAPDGNLTIVATDLRLTMGRYGHFYAAFSHTDATHAQTVSRIIRVLNAPGGPGLMDNYLGPQSSGGDGTGTLTTIGGQYDLSIGRLMSYPNFLPDGPDVFVSVFGMETHVTSQVAAYNDVTKVKYGAEATYSFLPWLAVSGRYDRVTPFTNNEKYSFAVMSPRLIFRTGWTATDQVVLQYSHWLNGSKSTVRTGDPPKQDDTIIPDTDMISLSASMWW